MGGWSAAGIQCVEATDLLNILQCTGQPPDNNELSGPKTSIELSLRNPDLELSVSIRAHTTTHTYIKESRLPATLL